MKTPHEPSSLRVGKIRYHNTLPFYHGLAPLLEETGWELEWVSGTPVQINQKMRSGEIDLAPISSLEYLNHPDQYLLLPDLCIGSRDFSASVLLLSKVPVEGLNGASISISEESLSAATLLKILLKFKYRFENSFHVMPSNPAQMLARSQACLVIGDEGLFYRPKAFLYKTDLSELWWDWLAQPFCFSVWAVRKSYYEEHTGEVSRFHEKLKFNLEKNLQDIEKLLREGLGLTLADEKFPVLFGYLFNLSYGLDESMKEGLGQFFRYAHELGVSPPFKDLEFIGAEAREKHGPF